MSKKIKYKIHKFEQRSDEWYKIRLGKMTASNAVTVGNNGKGLETYCYKLVAELLTNKLVIPEITEDMQRGIDLENEARVLFEIETGLKVDEIGFASYGDYAGCSPDGVTADGKGNIEIKCLQPPAHVDMLTGGKIDRKYLLQIQFQMACTSAEWCDAIFYNPSFPGRNSKLEIRIEKDIEIIDSIEEAIHKFGTELTALTKQLS